MVGVPVSDLVGRTPPSTLVTNTVTSLRCRTDPHGGRVAVTTKLSRGGRVYVSLYPCV